MAVTLLDEDAVERRGHGWLATVVELAGPLSLREDKPMASRIVAGAKLGSGHPLGGSGDSWKQLGWGDVLGRDVSIVGDFCLCEPHCDVDHRGGVDLHRDGVDVGGVEGAEVEDFLEVEKHPLNGPSFDVEAHGVHGGELVGIEDVGEVLPDLAPILDADPPERTGGLAGSGTDEPILDAGTMCHGVFEAPELLELDPLLPAGEPKKAVGGEYGKDSGGGIKSVGQEQRAARDPAEKLARKNKFGAGGRRVEMEPMKDATEQVVGRDDGAGKRDGADIVQRFEPPMDWVELGSVHDEDACKVLAKMRDRLGEDGLGIGKKLVHESVKERGEESPVEPLATKEECLGRSRHLWPALVHAPGCLFDGEREALGRSQNDPDPELPQRKESPLTRSLSQPQAFPNGIAQRFSERFVKNMNDGDQIDGTSGRCSQGAIPPRGPTKVGRFNGGGTSSLLISDGGGSCLEAVRPQKSQSFKGFAAYLVGDAYIRTYL